MVWAASALLVLARALQIQIPRGAASVLLAGHEEGVNWCFQSTARTSQTAGLFFSLTYHGNEASVIMFSLGFC